MYRFDEIENIETMKNVCMFVKIHNELKFGGDDVQDLDIQERISKSYGKDISLFDLSFLRDLACDIVGSVDVPSDEEWSTVVDEYVKMFADGISTASRQLKKLKDDFDNKAIKEVAGRSFSAKSILESEKLNTKKQKTMLTKSILVGVLVALVVPALAYVLFRVFDYTLYNSMVKRVCLFYVPLFVLSGLCGSAVFFITKRKQLKQCERFASAIFDGAVGARVLEEKVVVSQERLESLIKSSKFLNIEKGKVVGKKEFSLYLMEDDSFEMNFLGKALKRTKSVSQPKVKEPKATEPAKKVEKVKKVKKVQEQPTIKLERANFLEFYPSLYVDNWSKSQSADIEKKNCNKDLISRVSLITDTLRANKKTNSAEFDQLSSIYCDELSNEEREKHINNEVNQFEMYKYYLQMVKKIEPIEKRCKSSMGIDYDSEKYLNRTASEVEKQFVLNYIWYIIENELKRGQHTKTSTDTIYRLYDSIKDKEMGKIVERVDLYQLYFDFIQKFETLIK